MIVGARVICVDDVFPDWVRFVYTQLPVKDRIYTVREVSPGRGVFAVIRDGKIVPNGGGDMKPEIRVTVRELVNPPDPMNSRGELGFNAERFAMIDADEAVTVRELVNEKEAA